MVNNDFQKFDVHLAYRSGFTILEMLIYTAIVGMILVTTVFVTSTMYNVRARVTSSSIVHESLQFAEARILSSIRDASAITIPASGTSSTLQLSMPDAERDPTIYRLSNGRIWVKEGSKANLPLTSDEVEVSSLQFIRGVGIPPVVRIEIEGDRRNANASYSAPLELSTSAVIRLEQ